MRKKILQGAVWSLAAVFLLYGFLQWEPASRIVTPKRYWRKKILLYQRQLERERRVAVIKQIQLKKKLLTSQLDIAQDVILGINEGISISVVRGEIEKLKESLMDSQNVVKNLELLETQAREKLDSK